MTETYKFLFLKKEGCSDIVLINGLTLKLHKKKKNSKNDEIFRHNQT